MNGVTIRAVQTANQTGEADLFDPFGDALTFVMRLTVDQEVIDRGDDSFFEAIFQIIDPAADTIVSNHIFRGTFDWGRHFWISKGTNWGPSSGWTTAERWGLRWGWYADMSGNASVFGFRGIFKASYTTYEPGTGLGSGVLSSEDFAVSEIKWFRLKEIYRL